jgi:restriction system protein
MAKKRTEEGSQFLRYFGPLLDALRALGGSGAPNEVVERIAADLQVPDVIQNELLPSGEPRFRNQVHWARLYLVNEGLVELSRRGIWTLTERGRNTRLDQAQAREIRKKWVSNYARRRKEEVAPEASPIVIQENENVPESAPGDYQTVVLRIMQALPASGFEQLGQRILREAGFQEVVVTGRSGDNGIDGHGILRINPLVSLKVLFQCKRYRDSVSSSHVRDFRGAMSGRTFTAEAKLKLLATVCRRSN